MEGAGRLLPAGMEVRLENDDTEFLERELDKIYKRSGLSILILVAFIFLINRDVKYLSVLFLGIVVNLSIAAIILYFLEIDLHLYSLAGLTISLGLVVDNAIVMMDHIHKYRNRKVFLALLAASLTETNTEEQLFGVEKNGETRPGYFERAGFNIAEAKLGTLASVGNYNTPKDVHGEYRGGTIGASPAYSFTAHIAEVSVEEGDIT